MEYDRLFNNLNIHNHDSSFDDFGDWLDQKTNRDKDMKTLFKIAASVVITSLILVACSMPLEHEEEIGYMIQGYSFKPNSELLQSKQNLSDDIREEVSIIQVGGNYQFNSSPQKSEIILMLPDANHNLAEANKTQLEEVLDIRDLRIEPIKDTVERSLFSSTLKSLEIDTKPSLNDEQITARFNAFLNEHSSSEGQVVLLKNEDGQRKVKIRFTATAVETSTLTGKKAVEGLLNDLSREKQNTGSASFNAEIKKMESKQDK